MVVTHSQSSAVQGDLHKTNCSKSAYVFTSFKNWNSYWLKGFIGYIHVIVLAFLYKSFDLFVTLDIQLNINLCFLNLVKKILLSLHFLHAPLYYPCVCLCACLPSAGAIFSGSHSHILISFLFQPFCCCCCLFSLAFFFLLPHVRGHNIFLQVLKRGCQGFKFYLMEPLDICFGIISSVRFASVQACESLDKRVLTLPPKGWILRKIPLACVANVFRVPLSCNWWFSSVCVFVRKCFF